MTAEPAMVYKSTLKSRYGLTDKLVRLLGDPDKTVSNPHYRSGPPSGLYLVDRVDKFVAEHRAELAEAEARRSMRQDAARQAVRTKVRKVVEYAENVSLVVLPLPKTWEELERIAASHAYDRYGADAREPGWHGIVATVRHEFTNYHEVLAAFDGKVGAGRVFGGSPAYNALRRRLDDEVVRAIEEAYPEA